MRLLLGLTFIVVFFAACSAHGTSVVPTVSGSGVKPQVWEEGPIPEQWQFFPVAVGVPDQSAAWLVADRNRHVWVGLEYMDLLQECLVSQLQEFNFSGTELSMTAAPGCDNVIENEIIGSDGETVYGAFGDRIIGYGPMAGTFHNAYQVNRMAQGPNKDLYFTCYCPGYIVRLRNWTPAFYHYPKTDTAQNVAIDNDNRVWVVLSGNLARLNPNDSHFTIYPFRVSATQLLVGPDDNLWFVSRGVLSRITTGTSTPALTRFALPVASTTGFLTTGPDGNLWLEYQPNGTGSNSGGLLQVTTDGKVVNKYVCPVSACNPANYDGLSFGITAASDGNIWFVWSGGITGDLFFDPYSGIVVFVRLSIDVVPSSVAFTAAGATQALRVSETNYSGAWTATSTARSVAKVLSVSGGTVRVQAVSHGQARIIITDAKTNYVGIPVTVP